MKTRIFATLLVAVMVSASAISAMAAGTLYSVKDGWYFKTDEAGTVTVKDNKKEFTYEVSVGDNLLGLQKGYTGQLKLVDFVATAAPECEHSFNQWKAITVQERNCETEGIYLWPCEFCDETFEYRLPGYHFMDDHNYDWSCWVWTEIPATCTEEGFEGWVCKFCGEEDGVVIDALGHDWDEGVVTEPTCTEGGFTTYTCSRCDEVKFDDFTDALGHITVEGVSAKILSFVNVGGNGSSALFKVTLELTFTIRDGDQVEEEVFNGAYYRNANNYNLTDTFTLEVGCYEVEVEVTLTRSGNTNNDSLIFSDDVSARIIGEPELICTE